MILHARPKDTIYPERLRPLARRPPFISIEGRFEDDDATRVAIVGSREALPETTDFAFELAKSLARENVVIISGGARGIDAAAHRGALAGRGRTWAVLGCGAPHFFPPENCALFQDIAQHDGALIRPFEDEVPVHRSRFLVRNRVLVALCDVVVVVQAARRSGALNAARWARAFRRSLWVVEGPPWLEAPFAGCRNLAKAFPSAVRVLRNRQAFEQFVLDQKRLPRFEGDTKKVFESVSDNPKHPDQLILETGLSAAAVATALLTLALQDVVEECASGLFQRKKLVTI